MGTVPYSAFFESRVRLQRLIDQRIFPGWLQKLDADRAEIVAEDRLQVEVGERFLCQVQGVGSDAYFLAECSGVPAQISASFKGAAALEIARMPVLGYTFELITPIQLRDAQQRARKAISAMSATAHAGGRSSEFLVVNASPDGMGVIAWHEYGKGDPISIEVMHAGAKISLSCEVRHCCPDRRFTGAYRLGLAFRNADRRSRDSWRQLIDFESGING